MPKRKSDNRHAAHLPKKQKTTTRISRDDALQQLPQPTTSLCAIPPYHTRPSSRALPEIKDDMLATMPFKHRSTQGGVNRAITDLSYERLEFLGDAYLELFASRLLFHRFAQNTPVDRFNRLLQLRETLVCNESLSAFAKEYGFQDKLEITDRDSVLKETHKGNKGLNKMLGDCFEAYVAAVVLDHDHGFNTAESWLAALWEGKIRDAAQQYDLTSSEHPASSHRHHEKALDFIGGPYVDLFATRIVFTRFNLPPGRMSQLTEQLVKNETMSDLWRESQAHGTYSDLSPHRHLAIALKTRIATDILRDEARTSEIEQRCLRMWALKLLSEIRSDPMLISNQGSAGSTAIDTKKVYNPEAKALLQKRIMGRGVKLQYESYKASIELKGAQLGQSRHFIAIYLTGYGYERKQLGQGEGKNKAEAGNWAAVDAMYGDAKEFVGECEVKLKEERERRKAEMEV